MKAFWDKAKRNWGEHVIFLLACLLCLGVYPLGVIGHNEIVSESVNEQIKPYAGVENGNPLTGSFVPAYKRLESIGIMFSTQDMNIVDGTLVFTLYDSYGEQIAQQSVECTEIKNNAYQEFEIDAELRLSETYYYTLETYGSSDGVPRVCGGSDAIGPKESGTFFRADGTEAEKRISVCLHYIGRPTGKTVFVYDICILLAAVLLLSGIRGKKEGTASLSIGGVYRYLCIVAIGVMLILISDESEKPLRINGSNLKHDVGSAEWDYLVIGESSGYGGTWASMDTYALNRGSYYIGAAYTAESGTNRLIVTDNGKVIVDELLSEKENYVEIPFILDHDSQEIAIQYWYGGVGYLYAHALSLHTETGFYQDAEYYAVVFCMICLALAGYMLYCRRNAAVTGKKEKPVAAIVLTAIALFSFLPYLHGGLPWGDDLCYHLIRIEGIKDGMRDGQFPVMIYPEGLKGYGYLNCMYPYLFLYIPAVIRLFGVSIAASYKTLVLIFAFLTAFLTYYSVKSMYPSTKAALMAALLYTCCPYRYTNVYARGAVGEALAMTFLPLLIAGLYHVIVGRRRKWWMLALGMTGLLQTHVLSVTLGGILCVFGGILFLSQIWKEKRFIEIGKAALMTLLLNVWFLVPFLYYYRKGSLWTSALQYSTYSEWSMRLSGIAGVNIAGDYRSLSLGLPVLLCAGIAVFWLLTREHPVVPKQKEAPQEKEAIPLEGAAALQKGTEEVYRFVRRQEIAEGRARFLKFLVVAGFVCLFLLSGQFGAWEFMKLPIFESLFGTIQFPWRLFGLSSVFFIIAGSVALFDSKRLPRYARSIAVALTAVSLLTAVRYQDDDFAYEEYTSLYTEGHESKVIGVPKSANTIVYPYEWRREGMGDALLVPEMIRISDSGAVEITSYLREGTTTTISYITDSDGIQIELPVQWYDGYRAGDELGRSVMVRPGEDQLVSFAALGDGQEHTVTVSFHQKPMFIAATGISILAAMGCACWYFAGTHILRVWKKKADQFHRKIGGKQDASDL